METLQQERSQDFRLFASEKDYTIDYQIIKNENQEKTALAAENFDNKERTESADAILDTVKRRKNIFWLNRFREIRLMKTGCLTMWRKLWRKILRLNCLHLM